jgi:hypothetical protein
MLNFGNMAALVVNLNAKVVIYSLLQEKHYVLFKKL